jgi:exonuclease VII small subunit
LKESNEKLNAGEEALKKCKGELAISSQQLVTTQIALDDAQKEVEASKQVSVVVFACCLLLVVCCLLFAYQ